MRAIAHILLNPLNHLLLVLLLAFLLQQRKNVYARYLYYYAAFWFFLIAVSPVPSLLTELREAQYPVFDHYHLAEADLDTIHILVLGGGHTTVPGFPPNDELSENALGRLVEGVRLQRNFPNSKIVCSGHSGTDERSQAEVLARTAMALGVSPQDTLMLPTPSNTEEEARAYTARFGTKTPLFLVTSAIHMPRAMYLFQQMGCDPLPVPTNHLIKPDPDHLTFSFKPSPHKIDMTNRLLHEYAGMIHAKWRME